VSRAALRIVALAIVLRVGLFAFADNKHSDAPMRALIAERLVLEPASAGDPRTYCQFGPLHPLLMAPFIALDRDAPRSSRYLSLLAGVAVFFPFLRLARRLVGRQAAALAALALAVSPLHLQASTTAASEALYLLLWVAALERLTLALECRMPRTFAVAGLLASLAALTRYDAWLALPMVVVAAWWFGGRARALGGLLLFSACAASLPVAWLAFGAHAGGDALFFVHYISGDHAGLGAAAAARYGAVLNRLRQLGIWALAFVAAMSLPAVLAAAVAFARGARPMSASMRLVLVAALGPPALYVARGVLFQSFEPLARFALVPGALLLPLAAAAVPQQKARAFAAAIVTSAFAFAAVVWILATAGRERIWAGAESIGALTRLDGEDRALANYLRAQRPAGAPVMIEPVFFSQITIAHAARIPWTQSVALIVTRTPQPTVEATMLTTGARYLAGYDQPGGWPEILADWRSWSARSPDGALRFGRWRLLQR
jgi:4-amino-4-deoxy-L-arabinose transferase-like glycosyltransferase